MNEDSRKTDLSKPEFVKHYEANHAGKENHQDNPLHGMFGQFEYPKFEDADYSKHFTQDTASNEFRIDSEGRTVFFADGLSKPGRIIPDEEKRNEISNISSRYLTAFCILAGIAFIADVSMLACLGMIIRPHRKTIILFNNYLTSDIFLPLISFVIGAILLIIILLIRYRIQIKKAVKDLPFSDLEPPSDNSCVPALIGLLVILLIFGIVTPFLFLLIKSWAIKSIAIALLSVFSMVAVVLAVIFLRMRK